MRRYDALWFVLLCSLLLVPLVHGQDTQVEREKLVRLRIIFETQLRLIETLENDLSEAKTELQSLRDLQQEDSARYRSLKQTYSTLLREHERETALLQSLRAELTASQGQVERLETSLKRAEKSLRRCWIKTGLTAGVAGVVIGIIGVRLWQEKAR